ncbi:MAG: ROK family protein [Methanocorpusculum sp.]|nr:ROK family protein [Methanocorpusculum sp.]
MVSEEVMSVYMRVREFCAAVDLGATNVRTALVNRAGECAGFDERRVSGMSDGAEISSLIAEMLSFAAEAEGIRPAAVGISTAGPVDLKTGAVVRSPNMHCGNIFLTRPLSAAFGVPAVMTTDCKAGALGEYTFGCAAKADTLVYLTMSTGIGAGVLHKGEIFSGADGNAGEVGHLTVDTVYNVSCGCGGKGHWEAYASGSGIPRFFREWRKRRGLAGAGFLPDAKQILDAANEGDRDSADFVSELAAINARGISSVICAYNPDLIVFDGPILRGYAPLVLGEAERYLSLPRMQVTELGGRAPLLGAAELAFRAVSST